MKKLVSIMLVLAMLLSAVSLAGAEAAPEFNVLSGISALSGGYETNPVLTAMQEKAVSEQEALWIKNGSPTDQEWEEYKSYTAGSGS